MHNFGSTPKMPGWCRGRGRPRRGAATRDLLKVRFLRRLFRCLQSPSHGLAAEWERRGKRRDTHAHLDQIAQRVTCSSRFEKDGEGRDEARRKARVQEIYCRATVIIIFSATQCHFNYFLSKSAYRTVEQYQPSAELREATNEKYSQFARNPHFVN